MIYQTFKQDAGRPKIRIFEDDTVTLRATLQDQYGEDIDLTGLTVNLYAKRDIAGSTVDITVAGTLIDADEGLVDFDFTSTETDTVGTYTAEIEINSATGEDETVCLFDMEIVRGIS